MRVLVCGGRSYNDAKHIYDTLNCFMENGMVVIHGGATGADFHAATWAIARGFEVVMFEADWAKHGRAAGPIRNTKMLVEGKPDVVLAFPGGRGTADMVNKAKKAGVRIQQIPPPNGPRDQQKAGGT